MAVISFVINLLTNLSVRGNMKTLKKHVKILTQITKKLVKNRPVKYQHQGNCYCWYNRNQ